MTQPREPWIGVDLDGTLAHYDGWVALDSIGAPIPQMVDRVKRWLKAGMKVKIFTARVNHLEGTELAACTFAILNWCETHLGQKLDITSCKDVGMIELWDDRAVQVEANTGNLVGYSTRGLE